MLDVIAGHIPFMVVDLHPALQEIREGKGEMPRRHHPKNGSPQRPTSRRWPRRVLPGFELVAWQGVGRAARQGCLAPSSTSSPRRSARLMGRPCQRREKTHDDFAGGRYRPSTPDSFAAYVEAEVDPLGPPIVKNSGAELE